MSNQPGPGEPEYLGSAAPAPDRDSTELATPRAARRSGLLAVALGAAGAVVAGGWAAFALMSDGGQPAEALPADTLAYVSVDLDPSAGQKVEALRIASSFPALREKLGLEAGDDLRRWVFQESELSTCPGIDYEEDVAPWIGESAALALVPGESEPEPVLALAVTDDVRASSALSRLTECAPEGRGGFAVEDGYAVIAETTAVADETLASAGSGALSGDGDFTRWTAAAGEPGFVTAYLAPEAPAAVSGVAGDFEGLGAAMRFADGTVEVEVAGAGVPLGSQTAEGAASGLGRLPASTGAGLSVALADGWLADALEEAERAGLPVGMLLASAEARTGLDLPADVETLLGDEVSIAVDSDVEPDAPFERNDLRDLGAGVRVLGDPAEIVQVLEKVERAMGPSAPPLVVEQRDGVVAFGFDADYVSRLAGSGDLAGEPRFRAALPQAERSSAAGYADFDAGGGWLARVADAYARQAEGSGAAQVSRNLEPLDLLGASVWEQDGVQHGLLRLTTD
jgi:Protein of unknown function (DUF3352)